MRLLENSRHLTARGMRAAGVSAAFVPAEHDTFLQLSPHSASAVLRPPLGPYAPAASLLRLLGSPSAQFTPTDDVLLMLRFGKLVLRAMTQMAPEAVVGADDLMPVMIYVVASSGAPGLCTHMAFARRFAQRSVLTGEADYYISCLEFAMEVSRSCPVLLQSQFDR